MVSWRVPRIADRMMRSYLDRDRRRYAHDRAWQDDVTRRLDALRSSQEELRGDLESRVEAAPSRRAWRSGLLLLALSLSGIITSALLIVNTSSAEDRAIELHEDAQSASIQAGELYLNAIITNARRPIDHVSVNYSERVGNGYFKLSEAEDAEANYLESHTNTSQIYAQITLAVSSAFFGVIAGWMLAPLLAERCTRRGQGPAAQD